MKDTLVRFGVAMEGALLEEFDALVEERGGSRSELLRDLVRAEVTRSRIDGGGNAVATLTLVYDHHVRDLTERLTDFQHALGEKVNSALHVHLDHDHCLEVIVMKGPSAELKQAGNKLLATRGVKHGGMEMIALSGEQGAATTTHTHTHSHAYGSHAHHHDDDAHAHAVPEPRPTRASAPKRARKTTVTAPRRRK